MTEFEDGLILSCGYRCGVCPGEYRQSSSRFMGYFRIRKVLSATIKTGIRLEKKMVLYCFFEKEDVVFLL